MGDLSNMMSQESVGTLERTEREGIMQIVTSWMEQGIAEGRAEGRTEGEQIGEQRGRTEGERALILRLLTRRIGDVSLDLRSQIQSLSITQLEALGEALLDFSRPDDLVEWLRTKSS
jgi:predicted transposase YdaD